MVQLTDAQFAALPAFPADDVAMRAIARIDDDAASKADLVRDAVRQSCGIELTGSFAWQYFPRGPMSGALVVAHSFCRPAIATCEITVVSAGFSWRPSELRHVANWLTGEIGLRRVLAVIPVGRADIEGIAGRAGFRFSHVHVDRRQRVFNVFSAAPDDILLLGLKVKV